MFIHRMLLYRLYHPPSIPTSIDLLDAQTGSRQGKRNIGRRSEIPPDSHILGISGVTGRGGASYMQS